MGHVELHRCNSRCSSEEPSVKIKKSEAPTTTPSKPLTFLPMLDSHLPPGAAFNRLRAVLLHIPYYAFGGPARLARDSGVSKSTISRLTRGHTNSPSYRVAAQVVEAIQRRSGIALDPAEIFSPSGRFPTPSVCALLGCSGCLPPAAWSENDDRLKESRRHQKPGDWSQTQNWSQTQKPGEWSRLEASPLHTGTRTLTEKQ